MLLWDSELSPAARALLDDARIVARLSDRLGLRAAEVVDWRDGKAALTESQTLVACRWLEDRAKLQADRREQGLQALEEEEAG
jgi:hypothetical protein